MSGGGGGGGGRGGRGGGAARTGGGAFGGKQGEEDEGQTWEKDSDDDEDGSGSGGGGGGSGGSGDEDGNVLRRSGVTEAGMVRGRGPRSGLRQEDADKLTPYAVLEESQAVRTVAFHPGGKHFAVGTNSCAARLCATPAALDLAPGHDGEDGEDGRARAKPRVIHNFEKMHYGSLYSMAWSSDGELLATCSNDKTVRVTRAGPILEAGGSHGESYGEAIAPEGNGQGASSYPLGRPVVFEGHDGTVRLHRKEILRERERY